MLTIFHTADWHLGQSFHGYDRHHEHAAFLAWLRKQLQLHQPDAMLIAGDIFDTINPSARATKLYYDFLANVRAEMPKLQLVITAGNHDSGSRLEAPSDLLAALQMSVVGTIKKNEAGEIDIERLLVPLLGPIGELRAIVIAMPFLRPPDVPRMTDAKDAYMEGIAEMYQRTFDAAVKRCSKADVPIIAIGHCHVQGGDESVDSERRITIGGSEALSPSAFPENAAYVALGHLHKAQTFQSGRIRYSGSPIPLSFSERSYEHRVLKVNFDEAHLAEVIDLKISTCVPLLTVPPKPETLEDVLKRLEQLPDKPASGSPASDTESDPEDGQPSDTKIAAHKIKATPQTQSAPAAFLEVKVLNDGPDPTRCRQIEDAIKDKHVRLASIKLVQPERSQSEPTGDALLSLDQLQTLNAEDIFINAYQDKYNGVPEDDILSAFREVVAELEANQ